VSSRLPHRSLEVRQSLATAPRSVLVVGSAAGFTQDVSVGPHHLAADEPMAAGGADTGPTPYDLLLAALGACTSMTIGLYARRKGWPLESVAVTLQHSKVHSTDCGPLDDTQRARLLDIANKCPVHRTLTSHINVHTWLV
jgi:uncharacterized OsmC-like protein